MLNGIGNDEVVERLEGAEFLKLEDGAALFVGGTTVPIAITHLDLATGKRTLWKVSLFGYL